MKNIIEKVLILLLGLSLAACSTQLDKLERVGRAPDMSAVENPTTKPGYQPVSWPLPEAPPPGKKHANSLWQPGARTFFRDQRAARVGDILRVNVRIDDRAELKNKTERDRQAEENVGAPKVFGLEGKLGLLTPGTPDRNSLFDITNNSSSDGDGKIRREEQIETQIAALVTQVLPNGNMVISGKQEIRVNYEIREIAIEGVVRREDINSDNTIDSSQVAEARINYGGRGQITDIQQPRWGNQLIDILSPF